VDKKHVVFVERMEMTPEEDEGGSRGMAMIAEQAVFDTAKCAGQAQRYVDAHPASFLGAAWAAVAGVNRVASALWCLAAAQHKGNVR
jgi:hypothetical protein